MAKKLAYQRKGSEQVTERQRQIMTLVSAGRYNHEIAQELGIAVGTVKTHIEHLLQKTHARNRMHLIVKYFDLLASRIG